MRDALRNHGAWLRITATISERLGLLYVHFIATLHITVIIGRAGREARCLAHGSRPSILLIEQCNQRHVAGVCCISYQPPYHLFLETGSNTTVRVRVFRAVEISALNRPFPAHFLASEFAPDANNMEPCTLRTFSERQFCAKPIDGRILRNRK